MSVYPGGVHPFADMFPRLVGEPFSSLCMDIEEHGLREPLIVTWDGVLVDGRNRWAACEDVGVEPKFERLPEGTTEVEILDLIMSKNMHRRHLDVTDRALLGVEYKKRFEQAVGGHGARTDLSSGDDKLPEGRRPPSSVRAAEVVGVGQSTIERAARVIRDAPELLEPLRAKEITINEADAERRRRMETKGDYEPKLPVVEEVRGGSKRSTRKQVTSMLSSLAGTVHATELIDPSVFTAEDIKEFSDYVSALNSFRRKLTKE